MHPVRGYTLPLWVKAISIRMSLRVKKYNPLPGFGLTMCFTLFYLSVIVLLPLSTLFIKTFTLTWDQFIATIGTPRVLAAFRLSLVASAIAALINAVFGLLVA